MQGRTAKHGLSGDDGELLPSKGQRSKVRPGPGTMAEAFHTGMRLIDLDALEALPATHPFPTSQRAQF
jgi:hypothetical protein